MTFLRDDMGTYSDLAAWRYGFDPDCTWAYWFYNVAIDRDTTELLLFGA